MGENRPRRGRWASDDKVALSAQERQLVEELRQWDKTDDNQLIIEIVDGVWDITAKEQPPATVDQGPGTIRTVRGTGATFAVAWDSMTPTYLEP